MKALDIVTYLKKYDDSIYMEGNGGYEITGISSLRNYRKDTLTWIKKGSSTLSEGVINAIVLDRESKVEADVKFYSSNPKFAFFKAAEILGVCEKVDAGISPTAIIAQSAKLSDNVSIGNYSCIGENVTIGEGTVICNHVIIGDNTVIGRNCLIKSGAVIGEKGFGYSKTENIYHAVPHLGHVIIGNHVDIGSNTCIDRGTLDDTIIKDGTKIDNLCHIAHNVIIEENCCIVANSTIAGSVHIERESYVSLSASILNQKKIGKGALVGMGAVVITDIPEEAVCVYAPAKVIRQRNALDKEKY